MEFTRKQLLAYAGFNLFCPWCRSFFTVSERCQTNLLSFQISRKHPKTKSVAEDDSFLIDSEAIDTKNPSAREKSCLREKLRVLMLFMIALPHTNTMKMVLLKYLPS